MEQSVKTVKVYFTFGEKFFRFIKNGGLQLAPKLLSNCRCCRIRRPVRFPKPDRSGWAEIHPLLLKNLTFRKKFVYCIHFCQKAWSDSSAKTRFLEIYILNVVTELFQTAIYSSLFRKNLVFSVASGPDNHILPFIAGALLSWRSGRTLIFNKLSKSRKLEKPGFLAQN